MKSITKILYILLLIGVLINPVFASDSGETSILITAERTNVANINFLIDLPRGIKMNYPYMVQIINKDTNEVYDEVEVQEGDELYLERVPLGDYEFKIEGYDDIKVKDVTLDYDYVASQHIEKDLPFTSVKEDERPNTGINPDILPYVSAGAIIAVGAGLIVYVIVKKKGDHNED